MTHEIKQRLVRNTNKLYWKDKFVNDLYSASAVILNEIVSNLEETEKQIFFDTMPEKAVKMHEKYLQISPPENATVDERRQNVQANWLATKGRKFTIQMIKDVCEAWKKGAVNVTFIDGVITINFIDIFGVPKFYKNIKETVENIKPAHIPLEFVFLTHSWRDASIYKWNDFRTKTWGYAKGEEWEFNG